MTKGYLCILAACGTTLLSANAFAEDGSAPAAQKAIEESIAAAQQRAERVSQLPAPTTLNGWLVRHRLGDGQPPVVAERAGWSIIADRQDGDRLENPRLLGPDYVAYGTSARLTNDGLTIQDPVVVSRNQWVSADRARVALEPLAIALDAVQGRADQAE